MTIPVAVAVLTLVASMSILGGQFHGEDEILVLTVAGKIVNGIRTFDPVAIATALIGSDQPPARHLLPVPFVWALGASELALRLPNLLGWAAAAAVASTIGLRLGGAAVGLFAGALLGVSGLFDIEALGHGHGVSTLFVMLAMREVVDGAGWGLADAAARRRYVRGGLYCAAAFLWFTSMLPVCAMYHALHGVAALRTPDGASARTYARLSVPFLGFYALYYAVFLGIPAYLVAAGLYPTPFGQLHHNAGRWASSHPDWESLVENLRGLNWYVFPFVSWALLVAGMAFQARRFPALFVLLLPYALLFSFYIQGHSYAHFFSYFCWLAPFGVAAVFTGLHRLGRPIAVTVLTLVTLAVATWTYVGHVRRYTAETFPHALVRAAWGDATWRSNVVRPIGQIVRDLQDIVDANDRFIVTADGSLPLYYFPDPRYLPLAMTGLTTDRERSDACTRLVHHRQVIRAAVSWTRETFCADQVEAVRRYPGADLMVTVFRRVE